MKKGGGGIEHLQGRMTNDAATKGSLSLPNLLKGLPVAPTTKGQVHRGAMAMGVTLLCTRDRHKMGRR